MPSVPKGARSFWVESRRDEESVILVRVLSLDGKVETCEGRLLFYQCQEMSLRRIEHVSAGRWGLKSPHPTSAQVTARRSCRGDTATKNF